MQSISLIAITLLFSASVQSELMGMVPGRSARILSHADVSIEAGASWYTNQLQWSTLRINAKPSPNLTLYADYAHLRTNQLPVSASLKAGFAGSGIGGGILFGVPDFFHSYDVAFKAAYHAATLSNEPAGVSQARMKLALQQRQFTAEFVFSPIDPLFDNGLSWYGSLGYVSTHAQTQFEDRLLATSNTVRYRDKLGLAIGAGVFRPFRYGGFYAGIMWVTGDPLVGGGFRYAL